jgi:hypothetical protein
MIHPLSIAPTITLNITIAIGLTLTVSGTALGLILHRLRRPRGAQRRPRSRWRIDYESPTGLALRISNVPPDAERSGEDVSAAACPPSPNRLERRIAQPHVQIERR